MMSHLNIFFNCIPSPAENLQVLLKNEGIIPCFYENFNDILEFPEGFSIIPRSQLLSLPSFILESPEILSRIIVLQDDETSAPEALLPHLRYMINFFSIEFFLLQISVILNSPKTQSFTNIYTEELTQSDDKNKVWLRVKPLLEKYTDSPSLLSQLYQAIDELLMNAIWDASSQDTHKNRTQKITLSSPVSLTINQYHDDFLEISITDNHGSFPVEALPSIWSKLFNKDFLDVKETTQGAGIGLQLLLRNSLGLIYKVEPGKKTKASIYFSSHVKQMKIALCCFIFKVK